jgi:prepilin-type N-terminal cleavage/methylation domain-containing protein
MKLNKKLGFTLVELLVVIGILGILAAGLLATIDPFEQLKKGRDATLRNTVAELADAVTRYNADKGQMPWGTEDYAAAQMGAFYTDGYLSDLINIGELKAGFWDAAKGNAHRVYIGGSADTVSVCFDPESKAVRQDQNTRYGSEGSTLGDADIANCITSGLCFWCVK